MTRAIRTITAVFFMILFHTEVQAQKTDSVKNVDLVDYIIKIFKLKVTEEKRDNRKVKLSLFPTQSNASGGRTVITSFNAAFLLGEKTNTNVSYVYFYPYTSFTGRYGFMVRSNIWLKKNSWNFTGEYFILNYPQPTWGLGGDSPPEKKTMVDYKHFRFHQNALKGIASHLAIGLGYAMDHHYNIYVEPNESGEIIETYPPGEKINTISSGLTLPVVFDNRFNPLNPQQGIYGSLTLRYNAPAFGSDDTWQSLYFDGRKYFSFSNRRQNILALRSYYWTIISGNVPYLDLPSNGWEPGLGYAGRGLQQNRYRSNAILYFETEYRFDITANGFLGAVVFTNITSASQYNTQEFLYWHPAAGVGLRMKFNKYSRINVTLDYGLSKEYQTVYLSIGEAF
jgi:outer membrane protein assembly factor BamA